MNFKAMIIGIFAVLIIYFFRPWLHPFAIYFYKNPIIIEVFLIWAVLHHIFSRKSNKRKKRPVVIEGEELTGDIFQSVLFTSSITILFFMLMLASFFSNFIVPLELSRTLDYS
ncbi:MAG: hypothetical protein KAU95_04645, partial [Candidatus Aenigmarchaeota archaeon]|nr:hypothetical protein [Candidatus Aenigmarchaeota archaeon]